MIRTDGRHFPKPITLTAVRWYLAGSVAKRQQRERLHALLTNGYSGRKEFETLDEGVPSTASKQLTFSNHVHELHASESDCRSHRGLESKHRPHASLDAAMVLLNVLFR